MVVFDPRKLADWSCGKWQGAALDRDLIGFSIDTRRISSGEVFVAINTDSRDGHDYLGQATESGASAAIVDHYVPYCLLPQLVVEDSVQGLMDIASGHRREFDGRVIGITGSCGKTSTKDALALFMGDGTTCKTQGNLNNRLGLSLTLLSIDPVEHGSAVVEAGISEEGEMEDLARVLQPDVGIVTLVGEAHMEGLRTLELVAREKYRLLDAVRPGGFSLFHEDCQRYEDYATGGSAHWVMRETGSNQLDQDSLSFLHCESCGDNPGTLELNSSYFGRAAFELPLSAFGSATIRNLSMALGVSLRSGVSPEKLQDRLSRWQPSKLRGEVRVLDGQVFYVDCYNANPASMREAIETFSKRFFEQPKLYVLGSMNELGEESQSLHRSTGAGFTMSASDRAVLCGPHAEAMREGMLSGGTSSSAVTIVERAEQARLQVQAFHGAILLKGSRSYGLECLLPEDEMIEKRRLTAC